MTYLKKSARGYLSATIALLYSSATFGFFLDGNGHYSLRGVALKNPGFATDRGVYQAIEQSFRLEAEARMNDRSGFVMDLRLTDDPRSFFLGDSAKPADCGTRRIPDGSGGYETSDDCTGRHQSTGEPGYTSFSPTITRAYARQAFEKCLVEAGRRPRQWGLGVMMDAGNRPFDVATSVYDGIDCHVNIQRSESLGFKLGYDKISETGTWVDNPYDRTLPDTGSESEFAGRSGDFGPNNPSDDLDQYFFTIDYDDRKANAGSAFTKQIGIYFANIIGRESKTDLKLLDIYSGLYLANMTWKNELVFRLGGSADPNWINLGGARFDNGDIAKNDLQSVGFAGSLEWTLTKDGTAIGPADYRQGNASRQLLFFDYAYAPGSDNSYYRDDASYSEETLAAIGESKRQSSTSTMAFHRNFRPALILFNGRPGSEDTRLSGVYDPQRVMNASVFGLGYRLESLEYGIFETKILTASLNAGPPAAVKDYFATASGDKPIGYHGTNLGLELDVKYTATPTREFEYGIEAGYARAGDALKISEAAPAPAMLLQSFATFKF